MKTGFKNRLEPKVKENGKRPFSYDAPSYDNRSSRGVNAGDYYGTGVNQPIGSTKVTSSYAVPTGRVKTLNIYEEI